MIKMNYSKIYNLIILNAKTANRKKSKDKYFESHHILPKCLNGTNNKNNLILLTAKEHFICHHLLTKIYPNSSKLHSAFWLMLNFVSDKQQRIKATSSVYENARKIHSKNLSIKMKNNNNFNINRWPSKENNPMFGIHRFGEDNPFFGKRHSSKAKEIIG